jgi:hypothetical protein
VGEQGDSFISIKIALKTNHKKLLSVF